MLKRFLLSVVLKTSFFPFTIFYKFCYGAALKVIIYILSRQKAVVAIYLTAGMSTDNYIYGLSDIDLIIIVEKSGDKQIIERIYRRLSRWIPFLKYGERSLSTPQEVSAGYETDIFFKYKFDDCRKRGKLLYGKDVLSKLPELDEGGKKEVVFGRSAFIWATLVKHLFLSVPNYRVMRNYICYKLSADSCLTFILARSGKVVSDRRKALDLNTACGEKGCDVYVNRMREMEKARFFSGSPLVLEDTYTFCFGMLSEAARCVENRSPKAKQEEGNARVYFEPGPADFILSDHNREEIDRFVDLVKNRYGDYVESILVSPCVLVGTDEEGICLFINPKKVIPFEIARQINSIINFGCSPQHIYLYIVSGDLAFSLNRSDFTQVCSAFFTSSISPLSFLFLENQASVLSGAPLKYAGDKDALVNRFLQSFSESYQWDENRILGIINDKNVVRLPNIKFHLLFWQALQLRLIKGAAISGKIPVPLSSAQVCRYWNASQDYKLNWLEEFHNEYKKDLNGVPSDSEIYFNKAVTALRDIYSPFPL